MKLVIPVALALTMIGAEGRYHAGGRLVLAPRQYQYSRGDWVDLMNKVLRASAHDQSDHILRHEHNREWDGPEFVVSHDSQTGLVTLSMEMPGVKAEDLDVTVEDDTHLRILGSRSTLTGNGRVVEFDQTFQLDDDVDPSSLQVTLQNGILQVKATKKAKKVVHLAVQIKSAQDSLAIESVGEGSGIGESAGIQQEDQVE